MSDIEAYIPFETPGMNVHLNDTWVVWEQTEDGSKKLLQFSTIAGFWIIYNKINLTTGKKIVFMRNGITPVWENIFHEDCSYSIIEVDKKYQRDIITNFILAMIGETLVRLREPIFNPQGETLVRLREPIFNPQGETLVRLREPIFNPQGETLVHMSESKLIEAKTNRLDEYLNKIKITGLTLFNRGDKTQLRLWNCVRDKPLQIKDLTIDMMQYLQKELGQQTNFIVKPFSIIKNGLSPNAKNKKLREERGE